MKIIDDVIIIGIDSGYGNIKTANCCFPASLSAYDREPVFKENLLVFEGKFYLIGEGHKEFLADKRIGEVHLQLPPNTPQGSPIRVVFRSSTIGLEVTATNVETGESAKTVIESDVLYSEDDLKKAKSHFEGIQTSGQI